MEQALGSAEAVSFLLEVEEAPWCEDSGALLTRAKADWGRLAEAASSANTAAVAMSEGCCAVAPGTDEAESPPESPWDADDACLEAVGDGGASCCSRMTLSAAMRSLHHSEPCTNMHIAQTSFWLAGRQEGSLQTPVQVLQRRHGHMHGRHGRSHELADVLPGSQTTNCLALQCSTQFTFQ